jgi:alpha-1,3-glucan synthase
MLWGTSSLALYIPWAGRAGPYLGLSLWLWLGVLDAVQGVGLGMILLQTLSRLHVCATLAFAQIIGSVCVMVARATAPNRIGPGTVFPDIATWDFQADGLSGSPMAKAPFWIALICQLIIVIGYFWFYRKEQLGAFISDFSPRQRLMKILFHSTTMIYDHSLSHLPHSLRTALDYFSLPGPVFVTALTTFF